jgi:preprotein translocase subunit YajC
MILGYHGLAEATSSGALGMIRLGAGPVPGPCVHPSAVLSGERNMALLSSAVFEVPAVLLAQNGDAAAPPPLFSLWPLVAIGLLFYFLLIAPQQREKKQHRAQLASVKKNDRVITVGGIYGVVTNVQHENDEVTIKVDETSNTKLRMTVNSIARVLGDDTSKPSS